MKLKGGKCCLKASQLNVILTVLKYRSAECCENSLGGYITEIQISERISAAQLGSIPVEGSVILQKETELNIMFSKPTSSGGTTERCNERCSVLSAYKYFCSCKKVQSQAAN